MKNNEKVLLGILIAIVVLLGLIFILNSNNPKTPTTKLEKVELAINPFPNSALVHIAQEKGFFREQGLDVEYHSFATGKLALDAAIGGGADIVTTADVPITLAGLAGQKLSVIATIEYSNDNIQVVARKDSGIDEPKDLEGKKISITNGGGPLYYSNEFFKKYGIDNKKVSFVYQKPNEMVTSFIKGDVDAFIVFEPYPFLAINQLGKEKVIVFADTELYGETWDIVVMPEYEKTHKETIKKFLRALIKAEDFYNTNPEESLKIVSEYSETELDILQPMLEKQNIGVVLQDVLPDSLRKEAVWAINTGLTNRDVIPDYRELINQNYLLEIGPQRVTI